MERPYVDWVRIENFGCVRQADIKLTPLHALIGPNDSGKSTILRAIINDQVSRYWITPSAAAWSPVEKAYSVGKYPHFQPGAGGSVPFAIVTQTQAATDIRRLLRLDPDELRESRPLIPSSTANIWFQNARGLGLGSLYDALLSRDRAAFAEIEDGARVLFPSVRSLRLENSDERSKTLGLTLVDGTEVGPREMSEGMLYWLAFAIIQYLATPGILLIEEPENGLHPTRIAEVMRVLREVATRTQVIVATHSPLVINELAPEEVTVVTRTPEHGTICTPLAQTKNFAERSKVYALGELWLSYADGDLERELVTPPSPTAKAG